MRIMQIIPTLDMGGAENMLCNLAIELKDFSHDLIVVTYYSTEGIIADKIKEHNIPIISINKKQGFDFNALGNLKRIINSFKPDIIHTHLHVLPYVWLVSGKIKIVHTLHSIASKEQSGVGKRICGFIYKYSTKCIPVSISNLVKDSLINELGTIKNSPVIDNGVMVENIKVKTCYSFAERIHIYHVGRLTTIKNHILMINTAKELIKKYPNIVFHFWGGGEEKTNLERIVIENHLEKSIKFEGVCNCLNEKLLNADIFILPSQYEGMPLSLIEAMAAGLPCIASNVGGIPDVIDNNENGLLIAPASEQLYDGIISLLEDPILRERLGKNGIKKSKMFSSKIMAQKYIDLYQSHRTRNESHEH